MAWCGTAAVPLITHWSCCLAVGHRYNTVATGLGRKQSSNEKDIPHPAPTVELWDVWFFFRIYEIYRVMTSPQPHWNLVNLISPQRCTYCTPRTNGNVPPALIYALLLGSRECKWEQIALKIFFYLFFYILSFFSFFPSITWHQGPVSI